MNSTQSPQDPPDNDQARLIERPDGFYWQDKFTDKLFGPYQTLQDAMQDMLELSSNDTDDAYEVGESLEDAEAEIGIASWIDTDTGEPAEDFSTRLNND
ncbi:MAG: hypothetical protein WAW75_01980 [Gallionella sp.]